MKKKVLIFTIAALAALLIVQGVCAATPFITPTSGDVGTPFTITDPEGRIQPGDECLLYLEGTSPDSGTLVRNPVISQDGTTLTGTVPVVDSGNYYVTVRLPGGGPRFNDLAFFAGPACIPTTESCNGVDDDCDGNVDESLSQPCYTGVPGTEGVGICQMGTQTCSAGAWGSCVGEITPYDEEFYDGLDNDCDGEVDEGWIPSITPNAGGPGDEFTIFDPQGRMQQGDICLFYESGTPPELGIPVMDVSFTGGTILSGTVPVRLAPGLFGVTVRASADASSRFPDLEFSVSPCIPITEVCDGTDNNCNGIIDECPLGGTCIGGTCTTAPNVPEFPSLFIPLITIIGFLGAVLLIKEFRDH